jgi:hypothetical protein
MKIFMTIVRVVIAALAAVVMFVTPFWVATPDGTTIDSSGAIIDGVAAAVFIAMIVWMWIGRKDLA